MKRDVEIGLSLFSMVAVISALYFIPPMFMGHAIDLTKIPNISGEWGASTTLYFETIACRSSPNAAYIIFNQSMYFVQTEDKIKAASPEFVLEKTSSRDITRTSDYELTGGFTDSNNLYGDFSFMAVEQYRDGGGFIKGHITEFTLSDDCNSAFYTFTWNAPAEKANCVGNGNVTLKKTNPTGCGGYCVESPFCSGWSECSNGEQTQTCFDTNRCNRNVPQKIESRACSMAVVPAPAAQTTENPGPFIIIIFSVLIIAALGAFFWTRKKNEKKEEGFDGMINEMNSLIVSGEKEKAYDLYGRFSTMFSQKAGSLEETERARIYQKGMEAYRSLSGMI